MACDVIIDNFDKTQWEHYAKGFADYSIYQTWAYQQVRAEMDNQKISRIVIKDGDSDVATMCQVRIKCIRPFRFKIGYVQWGPLFRDGDGKITCTRETLEKLRQAYLGGTVHVLRLVPNLLTDEREQTFAEMLQEAGFYRVPILKPYRSFVLPTDDSEEEIRKRLRKSFRRDLKKAEKAGIEIRQGHDREFCKILEDLYLASIKRKGFKGLDPQEFVKTQSMLSSSEKMNIIVAYLDGEPIAAHLASNLGDTGVVLLAASNEKGLTCGASYLIWYKGAVAACCAGMKRYDLGGIDPDSNPNVYQFKSRMGGKECFHIGAFEAYSSSHVKIIWRICERIYRHIKK